MKTIDDDGEDDADEEDGDGEERDDGDSCEDDGDGDENGDNDHYAKSIVMRATTMTMAMARAIYDGAGGGDYGTKVVAIVLARSGSDDDRMHDHGGEEGGRRGCGKAREGETQNTEPT